MAGPRKSNPNTNTATTILIRMVNTMSDEEIQKLIDVKPDTLKRWIHASIPKKWISEILRIGRERGLAA